MNAVDTNVLVYADDPRDPRKNRIAKRLVDTLEDGVLFWQVACEYVNVTRRLRASGIVSTEGWERIRYLRGIWTFLEPREAVLDIAEDGLNRYSLSFWDSLLVAACIHAGVERLYTEDFDAYPRIDGLEIVNPFA